MKNIIFYFSLILLITCLSCKEENKSVSKDNNLDLSLKNTVSDSVSSEVKGILKNEENTISRFSDTLKMWSLPIGNKLLLTNFPDKWEFDPEAPEENKYQNLSESLYKYTDSLLYHTDYLIAKDSSNCQMFSANKYYNYYDHYTEYNFSRNIKKTISVPVARLAHQNSIKDVVFEIEVNPSGSSFINIKTLGEKGNDIDGKNIGYIKNVYKLTHSGKYFYIDENRIIHVKHFLSIDNQTTKNYAEKFQILSSGKIVRYFDKDIGDYKSESETGKVKNHTQDGKWIEIKNNKYVGEYTYLESNYKEGIPVGVWKFYNSVDKITKGTKLLMIENYSDSGELLKRDVIRS